MAAEQFTFFWSGYFSQWFPCTFEVNSRLYTTAEQYMMAEKARLFGDKESLEKILKAPRPREQKALGRKVRNFVVGDWNRAARDIVYRGNWHKFNQNKGLLKELLDTRGTTLVEASPVDRIWGIGLASDDERSQRRETWLGTNWLGEVLTRVRDDLDTGVYTGKDFGWSGAS